MAARKNSKKTNGNTSSDLDRQGGVFGQAESKTLDPQPIQVDQPDQVIKAEGKAATPAAKEKTKSKLHFVPEGKDRTLCGIFHLDPRMTAAEDQASVTCAVCLKALNAEPKSASKAKATRITIQCETCGKDHEIYEYQYGIVTRDPLCQKKYRRQKGAAKRRIKTKARKAEKRLLFKEAVTGKTDEAKALLVGFETDKAMLAAVIAEARAMLKA